MKQLINNCKVSIYDQCFDKNGNTIVIDEEYKIVTALPYELMDVINVDIINKIKNLF